MTIATVTTTKGSHRIVAIDIARTLSILAMVVFHLARDIEIFGLIQPGTTQQGGWAIAARGIAGSFLFLVGISLVLAHGEGIRWRPFLRRLALVLIAALAVSVATYAFNPQRFVYFGILHVICVSSILSVFLVTLPTWAPLVAAAVVLLFYVLWGRALMLDPWWGFTGLATHPRPALDLIPLVPWLAVTFLGIGFAKAFNVATWHQSSSVVIDRMGWPGRHSLAIYLLHQPLLLMVLWAGLKLGKIG